MQNTLKLLFQYADEYISATHLSGAEFPKGCTMKKFRLYITEWSPNGTSDLVITDIEHNILQVVEEAVFGVNGDFKYSIEGNEVFDNAGYDEVDCRVAEVSLKQVLSSVAVSPVSDGADLIDALKLAGGVA
jgi:hypothetical protein